MPFFKPLFWIPSGAKFFLWFPLVPCVLRVPSVRFPRFPLLRQICRVPSISNGFLLSPVIPRVPTAQDESSQESQKGYLENAGGRR